MLGCFSIPEYRVEKALQDDNFKTDIQEEKLIFQHLVRVTLRLTPILVNQQLRINKKTVSRFIWKAGS